MLDVDNLKRTCPMPALLHRMGLGEFAKNSCRSPFREDKRPSWGIFRHDGKWFWKDHGNGDGGDEITLLARWKGLDEKRDFPALVQLYGELSGEVSRTSGQRQSTAGSLATQAQPFSWSVCVAAFTGGDVQKLSAWRGYSPEFCGWLRSENLIGLHDGNWALPVHGEAGAVIGTHYRLADGSWRYEPKGISTKLLVLGNPKTAVHGFVFESPWDAFAVMDKLGWHKNGLPDIAIAVTRGAGNGKLVAGLFLPQTAVYAFKQNDETKNGKNAADEWLADVCDHAGCKVFHVATPAPFKDPNEWTKGGGKGADILEAIQGAKQVWTPSDISSGNTGGESAKIAGTSQASTDGTEHLHAVLAPGGIGGNGEMDSPNSPFPQRVNVQLMPSTLYYPVESVIGRFADYCQAQIETPKPFIVAGGLTLVSLLLNRRVFFQWGGKRIYPNLFQVCVGKSGLVRKSDMVVIVREFAQELCPDTLLADFTSHERFVECFAEQPIRGMIYSEGKNLIDLLNCKYGAALAGDMIRLYDCEPISSDFKGDKHKEEDGKATCRIVAKNTFLTVLIGIIPEGWRMPEDNQVNGLMGRYELLYADRRDHDILTEPPVLGAEREALLWEFKELGKLAGAMRLTPLAQKAWLQIQRDNRKRLDENLPDQIASNLSRMPFTVLRVAMLYEAAMTGDLEISPDSLEMAFNFATFTHNCYLYFTGEMQKSRFVRLQERIIEFLQRGRGHCNYSALFTGVSKHGECRASMFRDALDALEGRGLVLRMANAGAKYPNVALVAKANEKEK